MENNYFLTNDQKTMICEIFGKNLNECDDYEIGEMLDKIIDNAYENRNN